MPLETLAVAAEWFAFLALAAISVGGALGMATTMSMFRSGIFLMASFIGVAGLFILLSADLLGLLQVMMYVGGMLVMILFMVLFSHDPGGSMMAGMKMSLVERFFSRGLSPESAQGHDPGGNPEGMHAHMDQHAGMDMGDDTDMSMTTPVKRWAAVLGAGVGTGLVLLLVLRPVWPISEAQPDPDSARRIGELLMSKYMMAFEGAGLLILIGIFGAVLLARPGEYPDRDSREEYVTDTGPPPPIAEDAPPKEHEATQEGPPDTKDTRHDVLGSHQDDGGPS